ncbi:hypothetical protein [Ornithinimicrobium kibberense]|uniref:hypothetical protein n=1 Tax=Ornithinimicrobium kibberense TaxID=282060 RepID=UPI00361CA4CE
MLGAVHVCLAGRHPPTVAAATDSPRRPSPTLAGWTGTTSTPRSSTSTGSSPRPPRCTCARGR